ncbi:hypothetical protein B0H67DRAFT_272921 [Lasiosphaeris hirsuta]|uniref:Uncharacterized protein n=1 Tax=Lasiosphaeris hirsuta TaxID=260670 RepID=A0AA40DPB8_9PEZI|nr:hypothetical protein B0H67DRAFT_272921 [Lasiosphaeris hirsuta]
MEREKERELRHRERPRTTLNCFSQPAAGTGAQWLPRFLPSHGYKHMDKEQRRSACGGPWDGLLGGLRLAAWGFAHARPFAPREKWEDWLLVGGAGPWVAALPPTASLDRVRSPGPSMRALCQEISTPGFFTQGRQSKPVIGLVTLDPCRSGTGTCLGRGRDDPHYTSVISNRSTPFLRPPAWWSPPVVGSQTLVLSCAFV